MNLLCCIDYKLTGFGQYFSHRISWQARVVFFTVPLLRVYSTKTNFPYLLVQRQVKPRDCHKAADGGGGGLIGALGTANRRVILSGLQRAAHNGVNYPASSSSNDSPTNVHTLNFASEWSSSHPSVLDFHFKAFWSKIWNNDESGETLFCIVQLRRLESKPTKSIV